MKHYAETFGEGAGQTLGEAFEKVRGEAFEKARGEAFEKARGKAFEKARGEAGGQVLDGTGASDTTLGDTSALANALGGVPGNAPGNAFDRAFRQTPVSRRQALLFLAAASALSAVSLSFGGCGERKATDGPSATGIMVEDCAGRSVAVPEQVESIACLYAYAGHVCVLLGCHEKICAVVNGLKRDHLMERKLANLAELPCPYSKGAINVEELAQVAPDLVFVREDILQDAGELEKLSAMSMPFLVVDYITMEDQMRSIALMGKALQCQDRAQAYLDYYRDTVEKVKQRVSQIPADQRLRVFHSVNEVVRTDIPQTLSFEVLQAAGCENVVSSRDELQLDGDKGNATVEQIYVWDPDVVLANEPTATQYFKTDSKFSGLRAVREGRVHQLPVGISRWGHPGSVESPIAVLFIATLLYPQYFQDIDMKAEVISFYQRFFEIDLSDEDARSILSGEGMRAAREGNQQQ